MINRAWVWNAKLIFLYHGNKYNCMCIRIWPTLKLSPLFGWCKMCVEWICILWVIFLILLINVFIFLWYMYGFHVTCSMVKPKANFHTMFSEVFLFLFLYSRNSDQQSGDYANGSQVVSIFCLCFPLHTASMWLIQMALSLIKSQLLWIFLFLNPSFPIPPHRTLRPHHTATNLREQDLL